MLYGICNLSIIPLRKEPRDASELISQVLYGESFKILESNSKWSFIELAFDQYRGWIDNKQFQTIDLKVFEKLNASQSQYSKNLVEYIEQDQLILFPIVMGSNIGCCKVMKHGFEGVSISGKQPKKSLIDTALMYLNAPYLWGGKTPFGVDCSGLVQMVYKINGYSLFRDASQQATQGEVLSFIEESEAGDLAFFDNDEGNIVHVGILLNDNYIIHAHGKVRIDRIDHLGIFNQETGKHTHPLRVIKKMI
jgi:gamma-D-glutamyl-L-lysine dipeptidyl-peptidase